MTKVSKEHKDKREEGAITSDGDGIHSTPPAVGVEASQTNQPEHEVKSLTDPAVAKEEVKEVKAMMTKMQIGEEKVKAMEVELADTVIINGKSYGPGLATLPADAFPVFKHAMKAKKE